MTLDIRVNALQPSDYTHTTVEKLSQPGWSLALVSISRGFWHVAGQTSRILSCVSGVDRFRVRYYFMPSMVQFGSGIVLSDLRSGVKKSDLFQDFFRRIYIRDHVNMMRTLLIWIKWPALMSTHKMSNATTHEVVWCDETKIFLSSNDHNEFKNVAKSTFHKLDSRPNITCSHVLL